MPITRSRHIPSPSAVVAGLACALSAAAAAPAAAQAPGGMQACTLLTDAEVHAFAPKVGRGHPGHMGSPSIATCVWDNAHGIPALILEVSPADPAGVRASLQNQMAPTGYTIVGVPALGDDAAAAIQRANPKYGITAAVALLTVRVGHRQVSLSPTGIRIPGTKSAGFRWLVQAAGLAVQRLGASGG